MKTLLLVFIVLPTVVAVASMSQAGADEIAVVEIYIVLRRYSLSLSRNHTAFTVTF